MVRWGERSPPRLPLAGGKLVSLTSTGAHRGKFNEVSVRNSRQAADSSQADYDSLAAGGSITQDAHAQEPATEGSADRSITPRSRAGTPPRKQSRQLPALPPPGQNHGASTHVSRQRRHTAAAATSEQRRLLRVGSWDKPSVPPPSRLPSGGKVWQKIFDPRSGNSYYYNAKTEVMQWRPPPEMKQMLPALPGGAPPNLY